MIALVRQQGGTGISVVRLPGNPFRRREPGDEQPVHSAEQAQQGKADEGFDCLFIAMNKETSYTERTQEMLNDFVDLRLSSDGNELFGCSWDKKTKVNKA